MKIIIKVSMFICDICKFFQAKNMVALKKHYYSHRGNKYGIFKCFSENCGKSYSTYKKFVMHFYRTHNTNKKIAPLSDLILCKNCQFNCENSKDLMNHINKNHLKKNEIITCPQNSCSKTFSNARSFQSHVYRKHSNYLYSPPSSNTANYSTCKLSSSNLPDNLDPDPNHLSPKNKIKENNFSNLYTKLKFSYGVSDSGLQFLSDELNEIFANTPSQFEMIEDLKMLNTTQQRNRFFKSKSSYVAPQQISLGLALR